MMASDPPYRRLPVQALGVNFIVASGRSIFRAWPAVLLIWFTSSGDTFQEQAANFEGLWILGAVFIFGMISALRSVADWAVFGYRIRDGRLEVRSGILRKQTRGVSPDRIQNIAQTQNLLQRVFGLVELRVETASGGEEVEVHLNSIDEEEKLRLLTALDQLRSREHTEEADHPIWISNSLTDLFWYATTGPRWGWVGIGFGLLFEVATVQDPTNPMPWNDLYNLSGPVVFLGLVALITGIFVATIFSVALTFYDYTIEKQPDAFVAQSGLFTRRTVELPRNRVQRVVIHEPALRRLAGFATISLETAAGDSGADRKHAESLIPVVDIENVARVVNTALPGAAVIASPLKPAAPKALYRSLFRAFRNVMVLVTISVAVAGSIGWMGLILLPIAFLMAKWDHDAQGWAVTDQVVISRRGWWSRTTVILRREKLQSVHLSQGPFLRRVGLTEVLIAGAGTTVTLPEIREQDGRQLIQRLSTKERHLALAAARPPHSVSKEE